MTVDNPQLHRIPTLRPGCRVVTDKAGRASLMVPEAMLTLNPTGEKILSLVDGSRTVDAIVSTLSSTFSKADPVQLKTETLAFLKQLEQRGVLTFQ